MQTMAIFKSIEGVNYSGMILVSVLALFKIGMKQNLMECISLCMAEVEKKIKQHFRENTHENSLSVLPFLLAQCCLVL